MKLSVVIPVFNESDSVPRLHAELAAVAGHAPGWEFIFVDDGSRDGTWEALVGLETVQVKFLNGAEMLEVARDQRGIGQRSGRGDQGIRQIKAIDALKLCGQACDAGSHGQLWQERQERIDLAHLLGRERPAGEQLAFGDHGDACPGASSNDVLHQRGGVGVAAQMIDENVGIDEEPGHLQPKAVEPFGPGAAQPPLIADAGGKPLAQQASGSGHDLGAASGRGSRLRCAEANRPLHHLEAFFQCLNFLEGFNVGDRGVSHALSLSRNPRDVKRQEG